MTAKALVIEDDPDIRGLLERHLRVLGYEVALADTGELGLDLALSDPPDVVVVDIVLPGKDGRWVIRELRAHPTTRNCHVIVTSVLDAHDVLVEGVDGMLPKPFDRAAIRQALSWLSRIEVEPS